MNAKKETKPIASWIFRLVKGIVVGTGFIIPGVSGGVFAAIFGIYEPLIRFCANIRKDFMKNMKFFLPVGIGGLISIVLVSRALGGFFEIAEIPLIWFFIGCVLGTLPMLFKQAGKQGRKARHFLVMGGTAAVMCVFLLFIQGALSGTAIPTDSFLVWVLAGALMGLGAIVPGLSPSNFLLYMGIYGVMMNKMGNLDLAVLVGVIMGAVICVLTLSKAFDKLFDRAYAGMYHFILGVIVASTIMIVPWGGKLLESGAMASYSVPLAFISIGACVAGIALGYIMGVLEKKYKNAD